MIFPREKDWPYSKRIAELLFDNGAHYLQNGDLKGEKMFIKEITIENFGPIERQNFRLYMDKPNVIFGRNATGKTQLLAAIYAIFFDEGLLRHHRKSHLTGRTCLKIQGSRGVFSLMQYHSNQASNICFDKFEDIKMAANLNRKLFYFYFPALDRGKRRRYSRNEIQHASQFLRNVGIKGHHILETCLTKSEMNIVMSYSEQAYIDLVCFLSTIPENSVLIGDSIFSRMDALMTSKLMEVLKCMRNVQIILAENCHVEEVIQTMEINALYLDPPSQEVSPVSFNYREIIQNHNSIDAEESYDSTEETILPIVYQIGDYIPDGEKYEIELKEIKGNNPCNSIIDNSDVYVNAYLNGSLREIGKIYFGISNDRRITGVKLSYEDIDEIQRKISERLSQASPFITPDMYAIKFNKVATKTGDIQPDLYVVEVDVFPNDAEWLYSTSKGEVYIKTHGGKQKLSSLQIQEEILRRKMQMLEQHSVAKL